MARLWGPSHKTETIQITAFSGLCDCLPNLHCLTRMMLVTRSRVCVATFMTRQQTLRKSSSSCMTMAIYTETRTGKFFEMPKTVKPAPAQQSSLAELWGKKKRKADESLPAPSVSEEKSEVTTPNVPGRSNAVHYLYSNSPRSFFSQPSGHDPITQAYYFLPNIPRHAALTDLIQAELQRKDVLSIRMERRFQSRLRKQSRPLLENLRHENQFRRVLRTAPLPQVGLLSKGKVKLKHSLLLQQRTTSLHPAQWRARRRLQMTTCWDLKKKMQPRSKLPHALLLD